MKTNGNEAEDLKNRNEKETFIKRGEERNGHGESY